MPQYVGVDFGNAMVKAAAVESPDGQPKTLRLSERDPFLPLAVRKTSKGYQAGWTAFSHRRRDGFNSAHAMRDLWRSSTLTASLSGQTQPVTKFLGAYLNATGTRIQNAADDPAAVVVTVPDTWDHEKWSLPVAVQLGGWTPDAYVREWCAAMTMADSFPGDAAILISLGYSAASATLTRKRDGFWKTHNRITEPAVSGAELRKRIVRHVAESAIQSLRRDPREDSEDDQNLHDAVEAGLYQLHRGPSASVDLPLAGRTHSCPLNRELLTGFADDFRLSLRNLVKNLACDDPDGLDCPLVIWGELVHILPVQDWLSAASASGRDVGGLPLEALAAGAARLCASLHAGRLDASRSSTAAVCPNCGVYVSIRKDEVCRDCSEELVTLWESLPAELVTAGGRPSARLTLRDAADSRSQEINVDHFRLGRNPQSEWSFPDERFPMVSSAHASIVRQGTSFTLHDLGSTNGTLVNGVRVDGERELRDGDEIRLGQSGPCFLFELTSEK